MKKRNNKGFFLVETLIVTTIVAMSMVLLYTQVSKLLDNYDLRLTYNTVEGTYASLEINKYIINDTGKYASFTESGNIPAYGFIETSCTDFTNPTYCESLVSNLNISKILITQYNTDTIKEKAPAEDSFSDDLKLFIKNISKSSFAPEIDYRLIISFTDGTFATTKLNPGVDTIAPVITGPVNLNVIDGEPYKVSDFLVATDNIYGDISENIVCTFVSGITYNCIVTDSSGNTSVPFTRTVTALPNKSVVFTATGEPQIFTPTIGGFYKVELWGAQGGTKNASIYGGRGAYASAVIYIEAESTTTNVFVGGAGNQLASVTPVPGGFNGGGIGGAGSVSAGGSGGGATDIRIGGTELSNRILVAGGGGGCGGGTSAVQGGFGGALNATGGPGTFATATYNGQGGTQSAGGAKATLNTIGNPTNGSLGIGGTGGIFSTTYGAGGGGGGYYGGGGACVASTAASGGGGGGSSWYLLPTMNASTHFIETPIIIGGNAVMPDWNSTGTITGNGNTTITEATGKARFTFIST